MKSYAFGSLAAVGLVAGLFGTPASGQSGGSAESHIAVAKAAAASEHTALFEATCVRTPGPPAQRTGPRPVPERSTWHHDPVKVFDNLYYVGEQEYSAWALVTSQGIIVIDAIWAHSVEDEIVNGLRTLGFDPANIKYAIVSHAHIDHIGGAKYLQEKFGTRIVMSAADWDFAETTTRLPQEIKPRRDMVVGNGEKITLGDTTVEIYLTPGHTPGTVSVIFPVKDGGRTHTVATWGGTSFNFELKPENFQTYIDSAVRYLPVVARAGADNLSFLSGSRSMLRVMA